MSKRKKGTKQVKKQRKGTRENPTRRSTEKEISKKTSSAKSKRVGKTSGKTLSSRTKTEQNSTKQKERYPIIDFLKAFAALLVVLIHVTSRYRGESPLMFAFWDYIHFAVGAFVLATGFLAANSYREITDVKGAWGYLTKKFKRVVVPYYEFAIMFVLLSVLFLGKEVTKFANVDTIVDTVLLNGGVGNNWIPKLFYSLMIILLLDSVLSRKLKWFRYLLVAIALSGSIFLMTRSINIPYIHSNLFGWSAILFTGYFLYRNHSPKILLSLIAISGSLWFLLKSLYGYMGLESGIFSNKYPPDLYFVSYNIFATTIVWMIGSAILPWISRSTLIQSLMNYLSIKSYEVFFLHLLVMEVWKTKIHWVVDWIIIVFITLCLVWVIDRLKRSVGRMRHA